MSDLQAPDSARSTPPNRWWGAAVLVLAVVARLAYLTQLRGSILFEQPQGDAGLHYAMAREIAAGDWPAPTHEGWWVSGHDARMAGALVRTRGAPDQSRLLHREGAGTVVRPMPAAVVDFLRGSEGARLPDRAQLRRSDRVRPGIAVRSGLPRVGTSRSRATRARAARECPLLACNSRAAWVPPPGHVRTFVEAGRRSVQDWLRPFKFGCRRSAAAESSPWQSSWAKGRCTSKLDLHRLGRGNPRSRQ